MSWLIVDPAAPAAPFDKSNSTPWYIVDGDIVSIKEYSEMTLHGVMVVDGQVIINEGSRLRLQE